MISNPQIAPIDAREDLIREDLAGDIFAGDVLTMTPLTNSRTAPAPTLDPEAAWQQLAARDPQARFFYGVTTTGVFCRPGCASRRPLRENVRFFRTVAEAQAAGFRPCQRCRPTTAWSRPLDEIRAYLEKNLDRTVLLKELGRVASLSPFTVQRLFKREMGVSPLEYQRALRASRLRGALKQGESVTDAIYAAGFGSSSRAYEGNQLGMTPSRFAQGGKGEQIGFASERTPFGWMIVGATERGLCWLSLAASKAEAEASLRSEFPAAAMRRDPSLSRLVDAALENVREGNDLTENRGRTDTLDLRGTVFQLRVWQALRKIPRGETRSYSQLARELGNPKATRAVARACVTNRVALVVPCHRVVGADGSLTGYRWGVERKRKLLEMEGAR
ncbi:MAG: methylated-DNA--[protein]-cysteine S-methyltransferase [Terracidiphilus sp.]|jgi:AraC family transcriptional regulator of adaptative response/methylated-DNA-[protein]-cysteine methyltransferase